MSLYVEFNRGQGKEQASKKNVSIILGGDNTGKKKKKQ